MTLGFNTLEKFNRDERGNVAMMFAISLLPMIAAGGSAIDYGRVSSAQTKIHSALDAAVLAVAKDPTISVDPATPAGQQTLSKIQTFFTANFSGQYFESPPTVTLKSSAMDKVLVEVTGCVKMAFANFTGLIDPCVMARSEVTRGGNVKMEIAIAMDNSGSMDNGKIDAAKEAAVDFVNTLLSAAKTPDQVKIGLVPFTTSVNTGLARTAPGLDTTGLSPIHWENLTTNNVKPPSVASRFTLYDTLGETWGGCMETRPGNYGLNDDAPSTSVPSSLYVPYFAPDEPGDKLGDSSKSSDFIVYDSTMNENSKSGSSTYSVINSYLNDDGGSGNTHDGTTKMENGTTNPACTGGAAAFALSFASPTANWQSKNWIERSTNNICRYNLTGTPGASSSRKTTSQKTAPPYNSTFLSGPNFMCLKTPIEPITNDKAKLNTAIGKMTNLGGTNILEGFMWAWRVVSPNAPFESGRSYTWTDPAYKNRKIIILMTDGDNQWLQASNPNGSNYSPNGYYRNNRLALGLTTTAQAKTAMDNKTLEACTNAKAKKDAYNGDAITVYTIGFSTPGALISTEGENLLRNCASVRGGQPLYYKATTSTELKGVFASIAADLSKLKLSQ